VVVITVVPCEPSTDVAPIRTLALPVSLACELRLEICARIAPPRLNDAAEAVWLPSASSRMLVAVISPSSPI